MIINIKSQTELSSIYIVYDGSTNIETKGIYGISHLMEHLMCKNLDHLQTTFEEEGITWNAYTSNNEIVFYLQGLEENIAKYRYKFVELMSEFNVTKQDFEKERKIVLEEYSDCFTEQTESHSLNLDRKLFGIYDPIGLKEDLKSMKFMDCLNFYEKQYLKPTKIISVSKTHTFKQDDLSFADLEITKRYEYLSEPNNKYIEYNNSGDKTSLMLVSPMIDKDFCTVSFMNKMLGSGLQSPLYQEVREKKGLVYYIQSYQSRINKQSISAIATQTSDENIEPLLDILKKMMSSKNITKYLTKERFDTTMKSYLISMKKAEINRFANVDKYINPKDWNMETHISGITLPKVLDVFNEYYTFDKLYVSNSKTEFKAKNK